MDTLHYLWTCDEYQYTLERSRVQLAFFILLAAYTATRPGAVVEASTWIGSNEALCYKDVAIKVAKDQQISMHVTIRLYKGARETGTKTYEKV